MPVRPAEKYPVDICYMVADLKYSAAQGIKICEIQQASLSVFNGDTFRNPQEESIHSELLNALASYNKNGWIVGEGIADKNLVRTLASSTKWRNPKDLIALFSDQQFKKQSEKTVKDVYDLSSYNGILYISWSLLSVIYDFEDRLAGLVVMDKSSFPFWIDKYRMTRLFKDDKVLSTYKPKWGNYKKVYTKKLAKQIISDLKCDNFVIKPRGNFMGHGVIIVQSANLDKVLRYIITKKGALAKSKDLAYTTWQNDTFDSFIVEEFIASDPIKLPHLENKSYQPTMRVAFLLTYNNQHHDVKFLGEYWKTPSLAINEKGNFMEKNKDICKPPYYLAVDAKTKQVVHEKLSAVLPVMHRKMMQFSPSSKEELYAPLSRGGVEMVLKEHPLSV